MKNLTFIQKIVLKSAYALLIFCVLLMFFPVLINIIMRYVFDSGLPQSEEIARIAFVWMIFFGAAVALIEYKHIGIAGIPEMVGPRMSLILKTIAIIVMIGIVGVVFHGAYELFINGLGGKTPVMAVPIGFVYGPIIVSLGAMLMTLVARLVILLLNCGGRS